MEISIHHIEKNDKVENSTLKVIRHIGIVHIPYRLHMAYGNVHTLYGGQENSIN